MSVSLRSIESIVNTAERFYSKDAPLIYSQNYHIPLLLNIIGYVMHERQLLVATTTVPLIEPIYNIGKTIILSKSLIALYMNQPIAIDRGTVTLEHNVDLFEDLLSSKSPDTSGKSPAGRSCYNFDRARLNERFDETAYVRFAYVIRLVVMVAHWHQHYTKRIPYTSHDHFRSIEWASRAKQQRRNDFEYSTTAVGGVGDDRETETDSDDTGDDDDDNDRAGYGKTKYRRDGSKI